ncbi:MAG: Asp-tRNA(Asn)/Glu-tRNA(Gln) amidotransferase subunit GatB [Bdellovibrionales bacterium]|nr:Asp-tRNA(Asn)/Glu-tRNA(Gln) amidotransferase subunit GatB [Bdellovibrionales bacterium]
MAYEDWQPTIGLEIHAQLKTNSKIFSADSAAFGGGDNEHTSILSLGLPGALPVLNRSVVEQGVRAGLSLNCKINLSSRFSRKSYFYPDMPKGYQITQYEEPVCGEGYVEIYLNERVTKIGIERAHLEEDAGKSTHHGQYSLINLNRSGVPLLEIVSKPEMKSAAEAAEYARMVRKLLRYADVCDGNLEEGSLRVDCNVSVKKQADAELGTKVEIKNLNSFRFIEKAVEFEIQRQIERKEAGLGIFQETRLFDSVKGQTFAMRSKEEADDYRYFPDPDLPLCLVEESFLSQAKTELKEGPLRKALRYVESFQLAFEDASLITDELEVADYFEETIAKGAEPKTAGHWITGEVMRVLNEESLSFADFKDRMPAVNLSDLLLKMKAGEISGKMAKTIFAKCWQDRLEPTKVIESLGLKQISNKDDIEKIVAEILDANPSQVEEFRSGKQKVFGFFVGQIMKATKGQANPAMVNEVLKDKLK